MSNVRFDLPFNVLRKRVAIVKFVNVVNDFTTRRDIVFMVLKAINNYY